MERLNYRTLKKSGYEGYFLPSAPEKVMQFGEGVFLRAFTNYWFDVANEKAGFNGKCVIIKPRNGDFTICRQLNEQEGLYTLYLRGMEMGQVVDRKRVISSVSRCLNPYEEEGFVEMMNLAASDGLEYIVSNTTEAGIVYDPSCRLHDRPCSSFPGKLTQVLYTRYKAGKPGVIMLSCELIDHNGRELLKCVERHIDEWKLGEDFRSYVKEQCLFCSTLVDRIVTGNVRDPLEQSKLDEANGYHDAVINIGEVFGVWNIEGPEWLAEKLPFRKARLNCPVVPDVMPYKKRKVRILNASHTCFVMGGYLAGYEIVRDCMLSDDIRAYMQKAIFEEIIPTLDLDKEELMDFANAVYDRFVNPFVDHSLLSISLNSTSKWRTRILPSLETYLKDKDQLPTCLTMSLAMFIAFYTFNIQELNNQGLICARRTGQTYLVSDDRWVLEFIYKHRADAPDELVHAIMSNQQMWECDLCEIPGLEKTVLENYKLIRAKGVRAAFAACL